MKKIKDYLIKKFILKKRLRLLEEKKRLYNKIISGEEIIRRQIERFNAIWRYSYNAIPFYQHWKAQWNLPDRIWSLRDLQNFPLLTKQVIQDNRDIIFQNVKIRQYISTGGSTGEPTRFPSASRDALFTYADVYLGRSWWGILPLDSLLLFWGHSHLFGNGLSGVFKSYSRLIRDCILNIRRLNPYDMTVDTVSRYFAVYRASNPSFIVGYTSAIYKLAKYIKENNLDCGRKDKLKAVIITSETAAASEINLLKEVFLVPIVIEYGMAETGVIAYSRESTQRLQVFWDSFIVTQKSDKVLNVTTIYERFFPLINYCSEDIAEVKQEAAGSILEISSLRGRAQEVLKIGCVDGSYLELSGILIVHILKSHPHIFSIQSEAQGANRVCIHIAARRKLDLREVKDYFMKEIRKDHKNIDAGCIDIVQKAEIAKTLAGKERITC